MRPSQAAIASSDRPSLLSALALVGERGGNRYEEIGLVASAESGARFRATLPGPQPTSSKRPVPSQDKAFGEDHAETAEWDGCAL